MNIRHNDVAIPEDDPFKNCKLGRKKYAEILTDIITSYSDGFVLAINNEWGTGKTTFVKMWKQHLKNNGFKTLYFNAWENDFESNPLIALLSELKSLIPKADDSSFKSLLSKGALITKSVIPGIIEAIAKKYIDVDGVSEAIGKLTEAATDILKEEVDEYGSRKKGLIEFRNQLENFVKKNNEGKPLIFLIDELDRCRPTYAVEVLEQVKHFFNVPSIIFILSIDKVQLGNAVKGFYGSGEINAAEYLRRFIDLEYVIPKPSTEEFCRYLYNYFQFDDFFFSAQRKFHQELKGDKDSLLKFSIVLFDNGNVTLRQQEKIFSHARVVLNLFGENNYVFPTLYILLIYIKTFHLDLYDKIKYRKLSPQDLLNELKSVYKLKIKEDDERMFTYVEALLVLFYNNYYHTVDRKSNITKYNNELGKSELLIEPLTGSRESFLSIFESFRHTNFDTLSIEYLLNRIDLIESLVTR
jgi:KAP family P-loop domain